MNLTLTLTLTDAGRLLPRQLSDADALLVLHSLTSARAQALALLPSDLRPRLATLLDDAAALLSSMEGLPVAAAATPPPPPPADLLRAADAATLSAPGPLNLLIDNLVSTFAQVIDAFARRRASDPRAAAAKALSAHFFSDGRAFLLEDSARQWLAVERRFAHIPDPIWDALTLLSLTEDAKLIARLNEHFGVLIGLTSPDLSSSPDAPTRADHLARLSPLISRYLSLANLAWPSPDDDADRAAFLAPYLDAEIARAQAASAAIRLGLSRAQPAADPSP